MRAVGLSAGLAAVGVARAEHFDSTRHDLEARRAEGLHGDMQFTYRNPARSTEPDRIVDHARSLVVGAVAYEATTPSSPREPSGRVAAYARTDHYTKLRQALQTIAEHLRAEGHTARVVADDNALVDREAARRAGIGWYGKSSNLLLPGRGSWFVLGSVVTDAALEPAEVPVEDGCGACRRCIDACPTGAIVAPGVIDARRCLAWLVQAEGSIPEEFRGPLGDRLYGCDDCQEVCPPNRPVRVEGPGRRDDHPSGTESDAGAWVGLLDLLEATDDELITRFGRWYIPRRDPRYLRRNALVVLGNVGDPADERVWVAIRRHQEIDDEMLAEHATWAGTRLEERHAGATP